MRILYCLLKLVYSKYWFSYIILQFSQTIYNTFIKFNKSNESLIELWYCDFKVDARIVGTCAHIASVIWYLRVAKHDKSKLSSRFSYFYLNLCDNAANLNK